jgi:hypothetical protein
MAQHQTNVMGPHGPVFTKQLAIYEKVWGYQEFAVHSLMVPVQLHPPASFCILIGVHQNIRSLLLPSRLLCISALLDDQQHPHDHHRGIGDIIFCHGDLPVPRSSYHVEDVRVRESRMC